MDSKRWQRIDQLFQAVLEVPPHKRSSFLDQECGEDFALRSEVQSLLDSDNQGLSIIDVPAFDMVATLLVNHTPELSIGKQIGHYKILDLLGTGGMGVVYLALDTSLGRKMALKLLPLDFTTDQERVSRFQQEARAASALNHPSIITIYEIGRFENRQFIATEFIEGKTLRQLIKTSTLSLTTSLDLAIQVGNALAAAHQAGIVHRDIKPENIMVRPDGYVKVLDFGLAKLSDSPSEAEPSAEEPHNTQPGLVLGTAKYMSPEQARGISVDGRSDIFSLGVVLYELVAGHPPFEGETISDLIAAILKVDPQPLTCYADDAPGELQRIVSKTLNKNREDRYQTAENLLTDLRALRQELELGSKIQRAIQSGRDSGTASTTGATRMVAQTADDLALSTGDAEAVRTLSSARHFLTRVTRNKVSISLTLLLLLMVVLGVGYGAYKLIVRGKAPPFPSIQMHRITTSGRAGGAAISPDGKYIAYSDWENGHQRLWIRQIATSSNVQVPCPVIIGTRLTFSPDGNYLYFSGLGQSDSEPALYRMPALGGVSQKLINGVDCPIALSPDGQHVSFTRDNPDQGSALVVARADGTEERNIAIRRMPQFFTSAAWSPDGKKLACVGQSRDNEGFYGELLEIGAETGEQRTITDRRWASIDDVAWLSDGSGLLMTASEKTDSSSLLWHISYPGGEPRRVTSDLNNYWELSVTRDSTALVTTLRLKISDTNIYVQPKGGGSSQNHIRVRKIGWMVWHLVVS
jgi:serine/threonine protein kinase/Tol biopolymer transport system component